MRGGRAHHVGASEPILWDRTRSSTRRTPTPVAAGCDVCLPDYRPRRADSCPAESLRARKTPISSGFRRLARLIHRHRLESVPEPTSHEVSHGGRRDLTLARGGSSLGVVGGLSPRRHAPGRCCGAGADSIPVVASHVTPASAVVTCVFAPRRGAKGADKARERYRDDSPRGRVLRGQGKCPCASQARAIHS